MEWSTGQRNWTEENQLVQAMMLERVSANSLDNKGDKQASTEAYKIRHITGRQNYKIPPCYVLKLSGKGIMFRMFYDKRKRSCQIITVARRYKSRHQPEHKTTERSLSNQKK